ncbi:hypothetical protein NACSLCCMFF_540005 [Tenacibaculum maritimum]|nr:hypothetical protein NACSLCCMFF_540005 [Tenacibaculum maritimum]
MVFQNAKRPIFKPLCHIKHSGRKWTDHPKSGNVKVETEIKEKVNRATKIERVETKLLILEKIDKKFEKNIFPSKLKS